MLILTDFSEKFEIFDAFVRFYSILVVEKSRSWPKIGGLPDFEFFRLASLQIPSNHPKQTTKRKWTLYVFIYLAYSRSEFGIKRCAKSIILWSISRDQLNKSEVSRYKLQKMYQIK